jgi:peroxiredoxin
MQTALPSSFWRGMMLVALLLGVAWINYSRLPVELESGANRTEAPMVGFLAPDFTLPAIDGTSVTLSGLRGRPVILNFWATWCPPCRAEMPELEAFWQLYRTDQLVLLGIDQGEDSAVVDQFARSVVDISFPLLLDERTDVGALYGVRALPTTVFIDVDGRIQAITVGGPLNRASLMDGGQRIGLAVQP